MARKVSFSALESRSARLRLKIRHLPYSGPSLARGISLMYRRNGTNGTWVIKASDGHGAYWTKGFAFADNFEDADAKDVLTFYQAQDAAKKLARGEDGSDGDAGRSPSMVHLRLTGRSGGARCRSLDAAWPRIHLSAPSWRNRGHLRPPIKEMARACSARWHRPRSIGSVVACAPRWSRRRSTTSASRSRDASEIGLAALPNAPAQSATSSCPTTRSAEFVAAAYGAR